MTWGDLELENRGFMDCFGNLHTVWKRTVPKSLHIYQ